MIRRLNRHPLDALVEFGSPFAGHRGDPFARMNARMTQLLEHAMSNGEDTNSAGDGAQVQVFKSSSSFYANGDRIVESSKSRYVDSNGREELVRKRRLDNTWVEDRMERASQDDEFVRDRKVHNLGDEEGATKVVKDAESHKTAELKEEKSDEIDSKVTVAAAFDFEDFDKRWAEAEAFVPSARRRGAAAVEDEDQTIEDVES